MNEDYRGVVPYLFYDDVEPALAWYTRVFGFKEIGRGGRRQDTDKRPNWIGIWVEDVDTIYHQITGAGVTCEAPLDREFGVRVLNIDDGMGHVWGFIKRLKEQQS